jgi:hypothetical protein
LNYRAGTGNRNRRITLCSLGREGGRYGGGVVTEEQAELVAQWGGVAGRGRASAREEEAEGAEEEPREERAQGAEPESAELLG